MLCARFERMVDVYKTAGTGDKLAVDTLFGSGGRRMDLLEDRKVFCCADYYEGMALYSLDDGQVLWINEKIKGIQDVYFSDPYIYLNTEKGRMHLVSIEEGTIMDTLTRIDEVCFTDIRSVLIVQSGRKLELVTVTDGKFTCEVLPWIKAAERGRDRYCNGSGLPEVVLHEPRYPGSMDRGVNWNVNLSDAVLPFIGEIGEYIFIFWKKTMLLK